MRINYVLRGTGKPLLLLHGLGGSWRSWQTVMQPLAAERAVIAIDLPGFGKSAPLPGEVSVRTMVNAITQFLREHELIGTDAAGCSMGARLVLELARRGNVLGKAVSLGPGGFWPSSGWERHSFQASLCMMARMARTLGFAMPAIAANPRARKLLLRQFSAQAGTLSPSAVLAEMRSVAAAPSFAPMLRELVRGAPQEGARARHARQVAGDRLGQARSALLSKAIVARDRTFPRRPTALVRSVWPFSRIGTRPRQPRALSSTARQIELHPFVHDPMKDRMAFEEPSHPLPDVHGARELPSVLVDGYSLQLRGKDGFIGDQASQTAFRLLLERWRQRRRRKGKDPLGAKHSRELTKRALDEALRAKQASEAADVVHGAIEEFAEELAWVIDRFLKQPSWKGVKRIVIGGGFPESDVGERAVLQAAAVLQEMDVQIELARICHETDDAGLLGWVHLTPPPLLKGHDAILALDIGGTNVRCGIVKTRHRRAPDMSEAKVLRREKWRHADDGPNRKVLVDRLAEMLDAQIGYCDKKGIRLAPFIGIGCPGLIRKDGSIARGAQNLPGDWESEHFHLPTELCKRIPAIDGEKTVALMHNDAVVQGLSELPFMQDVKRWAVLTIGTGLGNASYTNKSATSGKRA